jgi:hypothetical protein
MNRPTNMRPKMIRKERKVSEGATATRNEPQTVKKQKSIADFRLPNLSTR